MGHSCAFAGLAWFLQQAGSGAPAPAQTHSWLPTGLGTWGFILALAALLLAIPMGHRGDIVSSEGAAVVVSTER